MNTDQFPTHAHHEPILRSRPENGACYWPPAAHAARQDERDDPARPSAPPMSSKHHHRQLRRLRHRRRVWRPATGRPPPTRNIGPRLPPRRAASARVQVRPTGLVTIAELNRLLIVEARRRAGRYRRGRTAAASWTTSSSSRLPARRSAIPAERPPWQPAARMTGVDAVARRCGTGRANAEAQADQGAASISAAQPRTGRRPPVASISSRVL